MDIKGRSVSPGGHYILHHSKMQNALDNHTLLLPFGRYRRNLGAAVSSDIHVVDRARFIFQSWTLHHRMPKIIIGLSGKQLNHYQDLLSEVGLLNNQPEVNSLILLAPVPYNESSLPHVMGWERLLSDHLIHLEKVTLVSFSSKMCLHLDGYQGGKWRNLDLLQAILDEEAPGLIIRAEEAQFRPKRFRRNQPASPEPQPELDFNQDNPNIPNTLEDNDDDMEVTLQDIEELIRKELQQDGAIEVIDLTHEQSNQDVSQKDLEELIRQELLGDGAIEVIDLSGQEEVVDLTGEKHEEDNSLEALYLNSDPLLGYVAPAQHQEPMDTTEDEIEVTTLE